MQWDAIMDVTSIFIAVGALAGAIGLGVAAIMVMGRSRDQPPAPKGASGRSAGGAPSGGPTRKKKKFNWLIGRSGSIEGKAFHVGQRTATIGRGLGNFIQVGDENVSEVHAQFRGTPSGMEITDKGSSNGTKVNGERIEVDNFRLLEDGDEVEIGDAVLAYRRSGNFRDEALTGNKDVRASEQQKTAALSALGGGELEQQVQQSVESHGGDYEAAADELGLDADLVETIYERVVLQ